MKKSITAFLAVWGILFSIESNAAWTGKQSVYRIYPAVSMVYVQIDPLSAQINQLDAAQRPIAH